MRKRTSRRVVSIPILFLASALPFGAPSQVIAAEETSARRPVERHLPSGGRALLWPRPGSETVLITVVVPAGSQDEPEGMGGLSHYLEHLLFDGFDDLDERGVTEAFEHLSAYMNAFTREQATVYFALVPRKNGVAAAELMAGMLTRSTIGPAVFDKEKKVILEELAKDRGTPTGLREERLRAVLWSDTSLEHPVGGSVGSVGATTRSEVVRYWKARYGPSGYRLLITGDLTVEGLESVLAPFARLSATVEPPPRPDPLTWPGWGEWGAAPEPEAPEAPGGMQGMGHGSPGGGRGPTGGTLAVVIAAQEALAEAAIPLEVLSRWLSRASGPLASALVPDLAQAVSVNRLPREPTDFLEVRVEAAIGADPEALLGRVLGALEAVATGPDEFEVAAVQRAWAADRALNDQRLHYAAVFYGEALAAARGSLSESVAPSPVAAAEVGAAASLLFTDARTRTRAAWLGNGGPEHRAPLPVPVPPAVRERAAVLEAGPLGSLVATLENGVVVGILPEEGSEVFGVHFLVADRTSREPDDAPGVADLVHRLLPGGTVLGGSAELARRMERAGIDVKPADSPAIPFDNRYHVPDFSYVRMEGPARSLSTALTTLAEMIRVPAWDDDGWRSAIAGHSSERASDNRGPARATQLFLAALLGADHPLARPVSGATSASVADSQRVRDFWGGWPGGYFTPDRLVMTVASPLPATETLELVRNVFSGGPERGPSRGPYPDPLPVGEAQRVDAGEAPQVTVMWGRMATVAAEHRPALLVAVNALSDRMTAVIREREGLAYRLGAGVRPIPGGNWVVSARVGTRPENVERVAGILEELVAELAMTPLSEDNLERLQARARRTRMLRGLSAASRAYRVGRALFEGSGSPLAVSEHEYAAVTPEQVRSAVLRYLVPEEMLLVVTP